MSVKKEKKIDHDFVQRIRQVVEKAGGQMALARKMGISQGGVQRYLAGGEPTRPMLLKISKAANINLDWLIYGRGAPDGDATSNSAVSAISNGTATLPLYSGAADDGKNWDDSTHNAQNYTLSVDEGAFAVHVSDASMSSEGLKPGCVCIVSPGQQPKSGDIVWIKSAKNNIRFSIYSSENAQEYHFKEAHLESQGDDKAVTTYTPYILARSDVEMVAPVVMIKTK